MKEIVKTLLLEDIDEEVIHRVLDVITEEYEVVDEDTILETSSAKIVDTYNKRLQNVAKAEKNLRQLKNKGKDLAQAEQELDTAKKKLESNQKLSLKRRESKKANNPEDYEKTGHEHKSAVMGDSFARIHPERKGITGQVADDLIKSGHKVSYSSADRQRKKGAPFEVEADSGEINGYPYNYYGTIRHKKSNTSESLKQELISLVEEEIKKLQDKKKQVEVDRKKEVEKEPENVPKIKGYNYGVPGVF